MRSLLPVRVSRISLGALTNVTVGAIVTWHIITL
jgi:hypothetical protein